MTNNNQPGEEGQKARFAFKDAATPAHAANTAREMADALEEINETLTNNKRFVEALQTVAAVVRGEGLGLVRHVERDPNGKDDDGGGRPAYTVMIATGRAAHALCEFARSVGMTTGTEDKTHIADVGGKVEAPQFDAIVKSLRAVAETLQKPKDGAA